MTEVKDPTKTLSKGQKASAESMSVVLASDQPALPITVVGGATEITSAAILVAVDGVEGQLTALEGYVDQIEGYVDGIETAIASTNTKIDSTNTKLDTLTAKAAAGFPFTKPFDELESSVDATHDYFTTKLATVVQQVLTVTYTDATKDSSTANYKVV